MRFFEHQDAARRRSRALVAGFVLAVLATVAGVHLALALLWRVLVFFVGDIGFPAHFFAVNVGVTLLLILGGWWLETSHMQQPGAAQRLAERCGARALRPSQSHAEQRLGNIVDEIAIAAHMPRPTPMVLPRVAAINAFAAGWREDEMVVAVTQGALDHLTRDELQGMVAHECSHIHEGDTHLNMQLGGMVTGLELVHHFGVTLCEREGLAPLAGWPVRVMGSFGWLAGRVLQSAVARQREFLADARTVQWTRSRDGIGGTLRKVMTQERLVLAGEAPAAAPLHPALHHLLLVSDGGRGAQWFDAHPPLAERVRRIYGRPMAALPLAAGAAEAMNVGRADLRKSPASEGPFARM
jgi:heat shock protein HtpX